MLNILPDRHWMPSLSSAPSHHQLQARFGERYKWLALLVVGLGTIAGVLATTSFSVAIPALARHFGLGQDRVQWAITGFMTAMTVAMLPTPWLLECFGLRRVLLVGVTTLGISSLLGSISPSFAIVVACRIVQGLAAGVLQPLGTIVVLRLFPTAIQGRASGILGFGIVLAPAAAPSLGGLLLDRFGWSSIVLLSLPFCLLAAVLGHLLLPTPEHNQRKPFDWNSLIFLSIATLALIECIATLQQGGSTAWWTWLNGAAAVLAMAAFVRHARRHATPLVELGLLGERTFLLGVVVSFSYGFGLYASTYLIPVFLQNVLGYTASASGLALLPAGIVLAVIIPLAGHLADRYPPKWITAGGLALFALSFLMFAWLGGRISHAELIATTIIGRLGLGLVLPALSLATMRHLSAHQLGQSSMITSYMRQVGGVIGIAIAAVFVEWRESIYGHTTQGIDAAYAEGFLLVAALFAIALFAASGMKKQP